MSEELENQLRKAFAAEQNTPPEGHEARFAMRVNAHLNKKSKPNLRLFWAAAAMIAGVVIWVALSRPDGHSEIVAAETNAAVRTAEHQFAERIATVEESAAAKDPVAADLLLRLKQLEDEYQRLGPALQATPDKPELIEAALTNLRFRTDIMMRLRQYLQLKNIENTSENEKNSHS